MNNISAHTIFLLAASLAMLILLTHTSSAADPGHGATAIGSGTFESGNYTFPASVFVTDYLGIGTTTPLQKFVVVGTANITGITYLGNSKCTSGYVLTADASTGAISCVGVGSIGGAVSGSGVANTAAFWNGTSSITSGSLGWGNISNRDLNIAWTGNLGWGNLSGVPAIVSGAGTSGYIAAWNGTTSINSSVVYQSGTKIGVGTTAPSSKLEINGAGSSGLSLNVSGDLFVNDTTGYVGVGTTNPATKLGVNGTIKGTNFLTGANQPVNDILLPQDVQNYGINALNGSLGMDVLNWEEKVAPTVFQTASAIYVSATSLINGNVLIATGNNTYGTFVIYDKNGNVVRAPTFFANGSTQYISATTLANGNVVIAYRNNSGAAAGTGMFNVYDSSGSQIKSPQMFNLYGSDHVTAISLTNGNVLIAYEDQGASGEGAFVIYDANGTIVKDEMYFREVMGGSLADEISATVLANGNILFAFQDELDEKNYGTLTIFDSDGNEVVDDIVFESASTSSISATTANNGNVFIAYTDEGNSSYGTFVIYDAQGNLVKAPAVFESAGTTQISATQLANGNVLMAYRDAGNSNKGTFVIYDAQGNLVKAPAVFESGSTQYISATALTNGNFLVAYQDTGSSNQGTFVIYQGSGARFYQDLVVDGNVGVGTTSPGAKLEVNGAGSTGLSLNVTDDLFVNDTSGRVGIGTTNPAYQFEATGVAKAGTLIGTTIYTNYIRGASDTALQFTNNGGTLIPLYINLTSGNVGIGTTSPQNTLQVNGTANISGAVYLNNSKCSAGQALTADATTGQLSCTSVSTGTLSGSGTSGYIAAWNGTTSINSSVIYQNGSYIGIGTANPATKLEVAGDVKLSNNGYLYSSSVGNLIQKAANLQALPNTGIDTLDGWGSIIGGSGHNQIVSTTGPNGGQIKAYRVFDDDGSEEDAGGRTEAVPFNTNATYRVSVWTRENSTGEAYMGVLMTPPMLNMSNGVIDNVPDFFIGNLPSTNTWYRLVAYIYPYGMSNSSVVQGGIYDTSGRRVSTSIKEFRFNSSATSNDMSLRLYSTYVGSNPYQIFFYDPRIEIASDFENQLFFGNIGTTGNLSISGTANVTGTLYITNVSGGGSDIVFVNSTGSRALTIKSDGTMILDTNDVNKTKLAMNGSIYILGGNGDVDGSGTVDATDRSMLNSYFNGANLTEEQYARTDVTGDGIVSRDDQMAVSYLSNNEAGSYENYVERLAAKRIIGKSYGLNNENEFTFRKNVTIGTAINEPKAMLNVYGSVYIGKNTTLWVNEIANSSLSVQGSIGIGTSLPNNKLTVIGDINATDNITTPKICLNGDCQTGWPSGTISGAGSSGYVTMWNGTTSINSSVMYQNGSYIGIGTTTPSRQLHISQGASGAGLKISRTDAVADLDISTVGGEWFLNSSQNIVFGQYGGTYKMMVGSTGNVGIGTTTPQNTLQVNGTANISGAVYLNNSKCSAGQALTADATTGQLSCTSVSTGTLSGSGTSGYIAAWNGTTSINSSVIYQNGSSIGIGTTNPARKLDVRSSGVISTFISSSNSAYLDLVDSSSNTLRAGVFQGITGLSSGSIVTAQLAIDSNGNVGIGTTSPGYKLHVNGTTAFGTLVDSTTPVVFNDYYDDGGFAHTNESITRWGGDWNWRTNGVTGYLTMMQLYNSPFVNTNYLSLYDNTTTARVVLNTNGNSYFYGGNVGIGTTNPSNTTHINGTFYVQNTTGTSGLIVDVQGRVGIGTTTPAQKLDVAGGIRMNQASWLYGKYSGGDLPLIMSDWSDQTRLMTGYNTNLVVYNSAQSTELFKITNAGSVGIGDTSPGYKLEVNGSVNVESSDGTSSYLFVNQSSGNVGIGTVNPITQTEIYGTGQLTAALTDAGVKTGTLSIDSSDANAGAGGAIVFGNTQSRNAGAIGWAAIKGLLSDGTPNTVGHLAFSTRNAVGDTALTERVRITNLGNVGIGTTVPASTLTVNGTANFTTPTDSTTGFQVLNSTNGIVLDVDTTNERVGIGTTVPTNPLTIKQSGAVGGETVAAVKWTNPSYALGYLGADTSTYNSGALYIYRDGSANTVISGNSYSYLTGGNVGIGTTVPTSLLTVNGTANFTTPTDSTTGFQVLNSTNGIVLDVDTTNERVGIGTNAPGAELDIAKATGLVARFASAGAYGSQNWIDIGGGRMFLGFDGVAQAGVFQAGTSKGLNFNVNSATFGSGTAMTILSGGNVGIGTTSPSAKLDVNGTAGSIVLNPSASTPLINTTGNSNLTIASSGGDVIIVIG